MTLGPTAERKIAASAPKKQQKNRQPQSDGDSQHAQGISF
jgi:hypothetical protein